MDFETQINFKLPGFIYIVGKSDQGKTYFVFKGLIPQAMKEKYEIHWVVNSNFSVEPELARQALDHKDYFIHPTKNLGADSMKNLLKLVKQNEKKKLIVVDNFTFGITQEFLDMTTFARKYNASVVFISHTLFASKAVSPRLRELVSYFIFFYMPISNSYKKILDEEMFDIYKREITVKSYKFLILDLGRGVYSIGKLPEYQLTLETHDQFKGHDKKLVKALKKINEPDDQKEDNPIQKYLDTKPMLIRDKATGKNLLKDLEKPPPSKSLELFRSYKKY